MNKFPIFIVSKGRAGTALTMRALDEVGSDYRIVCEASEASAYVDHYGSSRIVILPESYKGDYDTFWPRDVVIGRTGPGPARNFAWDVSASEGFSHHWVMDDNIDAFHRLHMNDKVELRCTAGFEAMEDFTLRFGNVAMSGPNYYSFAKATDKVPPFITNTRIYSCNLIRNDVPYRWRGTYNEDTDLSLRMLKDGWCTIQFNAFLQGKITTQRLKGGNTDEFYSKEGTRNKSQMLVDMHPDCSKLVWRFNRWHHHVDYKRFKQQLKYVAGLTIPTEVNNYGMRMEVHKK